MATEEEKQKKDKDSPQETEGGRGGGGGGRYFANYPWHVFLILGNEFCERFSYYGMRAILTIYLIKGANLSKEKAMTIYHAFVAVAYFTPMLGAIIADQWLGKYWTIFWVSILYCIGNIVMAVTSIPIHGDFHAIGMYIALVILAFGTGGIKPCVSSLGGDQFNDDQKRQKDHFFSVFYICINAGSLISMFITPKIRANVYCFKRNCYCLAFGLSAIFMIIANVIFVSGTRWYKHVPPMKSLITRFITCVAKAVYRKNTSTEKKEHWLDHAEPDYDRQFISDVKDMMRVGFVFLPVPLFWSLFDQQGSTWTIQATHMKGDFGFIVIEPDLIQVINPVLIVILVPLMEILIIPCIDKLRIPFRPLQKMGLGMILAVASFVVAAGIQVVIDKELTLPIATGQTRVEFINTSPCPINISSTDANNLINSQLIESFANTKNKDLKSGNLSLTVDWTACGDIGRRPPVQTFQLQFEEKTAYQVFLGNDFMPHKFVQENTTHPEELESIVRVYNSLDVAFESVELTPTKKGQVDTRIFNKTAMLRSVSEYQSIDLISFDVSVVLADNTKLPVANNVKPKVGAAYTLIIRNAMTPNVASNPSSSEGLSLEMIQLVDIEPWSTNILLQCPQYFLITLAECLLSVTGLQFSYTQAPASMKSLLSALWLLTVAFGNVLDVVIAALQIKYPLDPVWSFVLFAGLMLITTILFIILSLSYRYVELRISPDDQMQSTAPQTKAAEAEEKMPSEPPDRDDASTSSKTADDAGKVGEATASKTDVTSK